MPYFTYFLNFLYSAYIILLLQFIVLKCSNKKSCEIRSEKDQKPNKIKRRYEQKVHRRGKKHKNMKRVQPHRHTKRCTLKLH